MTGSTLGRAFLWDKTYQPPDEDSFLPKAGAWWEQFFTGLVRSNHLSDLAIQELTRTSREIAGLLPEIGSTSRPRPFKGVVVGAVQSGKTQSMMGLAATALDNGYRVVIVLAGVKEDLRSQTARRFNTGLLFQSDPIPGVLGGTTLGKPAGSVGSVKGYSPPFYVDCHDFSPLAPNMSRALRAGQPCLIVVKKHPASLNDLGMVMTGVYREFGAENVPTLILDDECDEATVPGGEQEKAIPEGIIGLWRHIDPTPPIAYVGYTATAAANLLQHPDWALYPHWTYLLRYPGESNTSIQFAEPTSDSWYSGGDCYYSDFGDEPDEGDNFLVVSSIDRDELSLPVARNKSLMDAFRAYFVSGAFRLALKPESSFQDLNRLPPTHSMMIHTSSAQEDHNRWAAGIHEVFGGELRDDGSSFDAKRIWSILQEEEPLWHEWYLRFVSSRERIYEQRPHAGVQRLVTWDQVKSRLAEVFENSRLKVVNSDEAGTSLDYSPPLSPSGAPIRTPDLYVIAVGGSRLSRGITVEGLCISYFARWANTRHDDTILQMSRWFGYRGKHLEFCRLFTTPPALIGLREVAENDLQLRAQLSLLMEQRKSPRDATLVFKASPYALPTAKTGAGMTIDLTFSPFTRVLSTVETGAYSKANEGMALNLVTRVRGRAFSVIRRQGGLPRGYLSQGWSAVEIATLLDAWQFEKHNPSRGDRLLSEYYKASDPTRSPRVGLEARWDPYQIAAYLRFWADHTRAEGTSPPTFNVGIAFGEMVDKTGQFEFPLLNRIVTIDDQVIGGWTGSSSNWRGDILFDHPAPELLDVRKSRLQGCAGLLLLYVVHRDALGKAGGGKRRAFHTPFFGISIPAGGPDYMRVLSAGGGPLVQH